MVPTGIALVVKRTFLEFVDDESSNHPGRSRRGRTMSDTDLMLPQRDKLHSDDGFEDFLSKCSTNAPLDVASDAGSGISVVQGRVNCWADEAEPAESRTTLMFRNLPNDYTRDMFTKMLDDEGFSGQYDFIYVPIDFRSRAGFGYAFVNMISSSAALLFISHFEGFCRWSVESTKMAEITWSSPTQGLDAHVERYRSSPVMHEAVPDNFKPAMFNAGHRVAFPAPSKSIKMPRMRQGPKKN